ERLRGRALAALQGLKHRVAQLEHVVPAEEEVDRSLEHQADRDHRKSEEQVKHPRAAGKRCPFKLVDEHNIRSFLASAAGQKVMSPRKRPAPEPPPSASMSSRRPFFVSFTAPSTRTVTTKSAAGAPQASNMSTRSSYFPGSGASANTTSSARTPSCTHAALESRSRMPVPGSSMPASSGSAVRMCFGSSSFPPGASTCRSRSAVESHSSEITAFP